MKHGVVTAPKVICGAGTYAIASGCDEVYRNVEARVALPCVHVQRWFARFAWPSFRIDLNDDGASRCRQHSYQYPPWGRNEVQEKVEAPLRPEEGIQDFPNRRFRHHLSGGRADLLRRANPPGIRRG